MGESRERVLALDFDGVISDSAAESFVVALRTLARREPGSPWAKAAAELENVDSETVRAHPLYAGFLELMPLGNRAEDFGVALRILELGQTATDQGQFDRFRAGLGANFLEAFHRSFYRERAALRSADPARWLALLGPFEEFVALLRRRAGD
jgi:hypothetical protein